MMMYGGDDDDDGGGLSVVMHGGCHGEAAAAVAVMAGGVVAGGDGRRVAGSELVDRGDPEMELVFGVGRKIPPEKISGGGVVVAGRWGCMRGEGESLSAKFGVSTLLNLPKILARFVQDIQSIRIGDDLLTGGRDSNLYTISISDMAASSPICLMSKATSTKSWLWHRRLSHLNFGTINDLTKLDLVDGLPKFKYGKDHLCSACERGKSKKASHPPKLIPSDYSKLELLHMDLCGPMRVASVNGKKYILVIVDDFSRFTWVYFLRSKDETPEIIKKFIAQA
ncbi:integrase, catalytic region, zinc finger, CCHC-type containing protein [Tanacetum coccineum]|uniref:Integrase, catalytic region, zinc finger, CCHC-type containing protein n=1 Tax=Tanacetum coccineum TaxID=301880 RepID=A0ABQ5DC07_9ASTR